MKINKFLVSYNPNDDYTYVLHTEKPSFLAQIFEHENKKEQDKFGTMLYEMHENKEMTILGVGRTDIFERFLSFVIVQTFEGISDKTMTEQQVVDNMATIMRKMADWYRDLIIDELE